MIKLQEHEAIEQFNEYLDDVYDEVDIAGYLYSVSHALERVDPIAYREAFNNWCDEEGIEVE